METRGLNIKKFLGQLTSLLVLLLLAAAIWLTAGKDEASGLYVRFLDVGQGDAELIQTPTNENILIDGGPDDKVVSELDKFIPFYRRKLDAVILTHPHADHAGGLPTVLNKYQVSAVYLTGVVYTSPPYLKFLQEIKDKQITAHDVKSGDYLDLGGGIRLNFLFPLKSLVGATNDNMNNTSIVNRLTYGSEAVLFMGDLESEAQSTLLSSGQNISADLLKVPHHGSRDSANPAFLATVHPKYAVIEVGKNNEFGHPNAETLKMLDGQQVFRTDQDGTVSFEVGKTAISRVNN